MEITDEDITHVDKSLLLLFSSKAEQVKLGCFSMQGGLLMLNYADEAGPCPQYVQYNKLLLFMQDQELIQKAIASRGWEISDKGRYIIQHGGFRKFFEQEVVEMEQLEERQKIQRRFSRLQEVLSSRKTWWVWLLLLLIGLVLLLPVLLALFINEAQ